MKSHFSNLHILKGGYMVAELVEALCYNCCVVTLIPYEVIRVFSRPNPFSFTMAYNRSEYQESSLR
jgi:hypothetical protein